MNFIKKIFENQIDEKVHVQFTKYGKGIFEDKALLDIRVQAKKIKIKTSSEFINELVEFLANTIEGKTHVKGIIFSTKNLTEESTIEFQEIKNAMGVKKHIINQELTKEQILEAIEKFPYASINLSFKTDKGELKIKEKAPKAGKTRKEGKDPKADYCVFTTTDKSILEDYAFDIKKPFKKAFIFHTLVISDIIIPKEYSDDFAQARLKGVRKGKLIRNLTIDGKEETQEKDFEA
ncbi:hypothetical protein HOG16_04865 [Candidatus Woesearchaeota archaeon]|jgi:hypothetical protein|nr:hypothetical protein [Candidatus Woesearchaeota archaeon]MBT4321742.1 hypothetical protein [Candidatus Woesearchaeota archaeon]MBT4631166.1 hypothetical protein [Candidatus Woesearchaeota archaeon]